MWGSAVSVAANLHLLGAMPPLPGGLFPREPMLEFDTTDNLFRDELLVEPLDIQGQVATCLTMKALLVQINERSNHLSFQ